jgi:hypothetical protein
MMSTTYLVAGFNRYLGSESRHTSIRKIFIKNNARDLSAQGTTAQPAASTNKVDTKKDVGK